MTNGIGIKRVKLPDGTVYEFHGDFTNAHLEDAMRQLEGGPPPVPESSVLGRIPYEAGQAVRGAAEAYGILPPPGAPPVGSRLMPDPNAPMPLTQMYGAGRQLTEAGLGELGPAVMSEDPQAVRRAAMMTTLGTVPMAGPGIWSGLQMIQTGEPGRGLGTMLPWVMGIGGKRPPRITEHMPPPPGTVPSYLASAFPPGRTLPLLNKLIQRVPDVGALKNVRTVLEDAAGKLVVGKITFQDWMDRVQVNMTPAEIEVGRRWYSDLHKLFAAHFGEANADKELIAWGLSQQKTSPSAGMGNVLKAKDIIAAGSAPWPGPYPVPGGSLPQAGLSEEALLAWLRGQVPEAGIGQKLVDFSDNTQGRVTRTLYGDDPRAGAPVTVDTHTFRDAGGIDQTLLDYLKERFGPQVTRGLRRDTAGPISPTQYENATKFFNDLTAHLNQVGFAGGNWKSPAEAQAVGWMTMQKAIGRTPETPADIFNKNYRTISYELSYAAGSPYEKTFGPMYKLPYDTAQQITRYVDDRVASEFLAHEFGSQGVQVENLHRGGTYLDYPVAPSIQRKVMASPETVAQIRDSLAYLYQQDEAYSFRFDVGKDSANVNGIRAVGDPRFADRVFLDSFWKAFREELEPRAPHLLKEDIQFSGMLWRGGPTGTVRREPNPKLLSGAAPIEHPEQGPGLFIGSKVDNKWNAKELGAIEDALTAAGARFNIDPQATLQQVLAFKEESGRKGLWKEDQNGQYYLSQIAARSGPGVGSGLAGRLVRTYRPLVESWIREAYRLYAGGAASGAPQAATPAPPQAGPAVTGPAAIRPPPPLPKDIP